MQSVSTGYWLHFILTTSLILRSMNDIKINSRWHISYSHLYTSQLPLNARPPFPTSPRPPAPDARPLLSKVVPGDSRHWYSWVKYFFRLVVTVTGCWQCARMGGMVHRPFSPEWLLGFINSNLFRGQGRGRGAKSFMCIKFLSEGRGWNWIAVTGEAQRQQNEEKQNSRSLGFSVRALDAWNLLCLHSLFNVSVQTYQCLGAATSSSSSSISWEQIANSKSVKTAEMKCAT